MYLAHVDRIYMVELQLLQANRRYMRIDRGHELVAITYNLIDLMCSFVLLDIHLLSEKVSELSSYA